MKSTIGGPKASVAGGESGTVGGFLAKKAQNAFGQKQNSGTKDQVNISDTKEQFGKRGENEDGEGGPEQEEETFAQQIEAFVDGQWVGVVMQILTLFALFGSDFVVQEKNKKSCKSFRNRCEIHEFLSKIENKLSSNKFFLSRNSTNVLRTRLSGSMQVSQQISNCCAL